jgi:hypothetical protein
VLNEDRVVLQVGKLTDVGYGPGRKERIQCNESSSGPSEQEERLDRFGKKSFRRIPR